MRKTYAVKLKKRALIDILESATFIAERSEDPEIANIWEASLYEHIKQLELFPASYPVYDFASYRQLNHGMYKIIFRIDDDKQAVIVCRVVHAARLPVRFPEIEEA